MLGAGNINIKMRWSLTSRHLNFNGQNNTYRRVMTKDGNSGLGNQGDTEWSHKTIDYYAFSRSNGIIYLVSISRARCEKLCWRQKYMYCSRVHSFMRYKIGEDAKHGLE